MKKIIKNEGRPEYIKPYKLTGKKCEKEIDARDIIRLESSNIKNAGRSGEIITGGNLIHNPEDIISNPDRITEQILGFQQQFIDDDSSKRRRVYNTIYQIPKDVYNLSLEDAVVVIITFVALMNKIFLNEV